jgi:fatty acid desaturase
LENILSEDCGDCKQYLFFLFSEMAGSCVGPSAAVSIGQGRMPGIDWNLRDRTMSDTSFAETPRRSTGLLYAPPPADMPIPNRLNVMLVVLVFAAAVGLLWLGSWVEHWYSLAGVGVLFSFVLLTNYALLHEAVHGNLHSSSRANFWLGVTAGILFPIPFSMVRATHQGHHLRNRTDFEMFDLYYPTDSRLIKFVQWYGILCGLFWPWIPIGAVLFALCPAVLRSRIFVRARSSHHLLGDIRAGEVRAIRWQLLLTGAFFAGAFWLLNLHWLHTLVLYACFSLNWSTRQYVGHAFTRRDVIDGAWNLRTSRLMSWILLHGEYDLNHHRRPDVPWWYLPKLTQPGDARPSYLRQYWRQWLGPRPATEPAPESVQQIPLTIHS